MQGTLYIVATPIGNLEDITFRALRILKEVDIIFCEDTRITKRLLNKYNIDTVTRSLNARTEEQKLDLVVGLLSDGKDVAYVSDAGTPCISDPGVRLLARARAEHIKVITIPGPSALTAALQVAGVPTKSFTFFGFLPQKRGRQTAIKKLASMSHTVILYESTHRILKLLKELREHIPTSHQVTLARELTKIHEELLQGTPEELLEILEHNPQKQRGEFVVIISKC